MAPESVLVAASMRATAPTSSALGAALEPPDSADSTPLSTSLFSVVSAPPPARAPTRLRRPARGFAVPLAA